MDSTVAILHKKIFSIALTQKHIAIACSGGVDSIFLAKITAEVCQQLNIKLYGLVVNHNLQENSNAVAHGTQNILQNWGIETVILTWSHENIETGIEESARNARYNLITDFCKKNSITSVLLAHHIDDKIETFFMNAMRGTGLQGISSMREITQKNGITFYRPMLYLCDKPYICNCAKTHNLKWFEDESNKNTKFTRNSIRMQLNLNQTQKNGIIATIQNLEKEADEKLSHVKAFCERNVLQKNLCLKVSIKFLEQELPSTFRSIIMQMLKMMYWCSFKEIRQSTIENFYEWFHSGQAKKTLAGCVFFKKQGDLYIFPEYKKLSSNFINASETIIWNNVTKFECNADCVVFALGNLPFSVKKKLKIKNPFSEIAHLPVFMKENNILAIPHLGIFNDADFKITFHENYSS